MSDYQIEIFTGNLGKDPESRFTSSGQKVCSFSVASNRQYKSSNGETVKETTWRRVSVWGKLADVCGEYLKKGSRVLVEGRLSPDKSTGGPKTFTNQEGGTTATFEVTAVSVTFLSPRQDSDMTEAAQELGGQLPPEEDIPF